MLFSHLVTVTPESATNLHPQHRAHKARLHLPTFHLPPPATTTGMPCPVLLGRIEPLSITKVLTGIPWSPPVRDPQSTNPLLSAEDVSIGRGCSELKLGASVWRNPFRATKRQQHNQVVARLVRVHPSVGKREAQMRLSSTCFWM